MINRLLITLTFSFLSLGAIAQVNFSTQNFVDGQFFSAKNCAADMNGDMLDDIVGFGPSSIYIYYQEKDGSFSSKPIRKNFSTSADWSICAGDIDGNGFNDLLIGGQQNVSFIYANQNGSEYNEVSKPDYIFSQRTSFADIDNDGHLDAFICHDEDENHPYRNNGTGTLTLDRDLIKTPENTPGNYAVTWMDYDNDGDIDMYLAKCVSQAPPGDPDRTNLLYTNDGNGNYVETGSEASLDDNAQSWVALFEDYDNDGDLDVVILNHDMANRIMKNNGDGTFTDVIASSGFLGEDVGSYEGLAADFDNDGNMDFITDLPQAIYYGNGDLTFRKADIAAPAGALGDFNSDGFIDILYDWTIYRNDANGNNWIRVNTVGRESNRNGIGARLELYGAWGIQIREVRATQSWSPMSTLGINFGIGEATVIDSLIVRWPSGIESKIINPTINQALVVDELDCPFGVPELLVDGELLLCPGETVILTAPSGYSPYLWSNGETSNSIEVSETGTYNVTMFDSNDCSIFSKNIYVAALIDEASIHAPFGTDFCPGNTALLEVDSAFEVIWSNGSTENFIYTFEAGEFYASIQNDCGVQINTDTITIAEFPAAPPVVEDVYVVADTNLVVLHVDGDFLIWWTEEEGGDFLYTGNDYFISDFSMDQTFWVQEVYFLDNGSECYSPRVPISVYLISSTSELEQELELKVFPNPATDVISVSLNDMRDVKSIKLMDLNGKMVKEKQDNFSLLTNLNVGAVNAGVYVLQIQINDNLISKRIVLVE